MARKRMIDPGFWLDEKLGTVPALARLLFMGLISNADDEGRLPGHPALIKSQIFPYDADITVGQVSEWLKMLSQLDIIAIYTVSSQTYIQVNNFLKHQTINRPTASKYPDPSMDTHGGFNEDSLPKEDKEKGKEIQEKGREENPGTPSSDGTHAPLNAIVESYNRYCISLPRVKTITDKRQKTIRSRWRTYSSLDIFDKVFQMAQASDFLSGRNGKWTGCNFDWLINENNMVKVLEGNYENKKQKTGLDALKELYDEDDDE